MDESLRALERAVTAAPGDEATVRAFLAATARVAPDPGERKGTKPLGGRPVLGPLLADEAERLRGVDSSVVLVDSMGVAWVAVDEPRGRVLFDATIQLRLLELERWTREARPGATGPSPSMQWVALQGTIDAAFEAATERLLRFVTAEDIVLGQRAADVLASRPEPEVGQRLAKLVRELPAILRPRIYGALSRGIVPLVAEARADLRASITRELPAAREKAYEALRRGATVEDLKKDHAVAQPEIRAAALHDLVERVGAIEAHDIVRRALDDPEALVRRAAVRIIGESWSSHPRALDWAIGRLVDKDRAVRVEALRIVRRIPLSPRQIPRLKLIVDGAPPGIRPGLERLLELVERRASGRRAPGPELDDEDE